MSRSDVDIPGRAFGGSHAARRRAGRSKTVWINARVPGRAPNHVIFRSYWHLEASEQEALAVLRDYAGISGWWGRTFLATPVLHRPESGLVGLVGTVTSRGFMPYIFHWRAEVIAADRDAVTLAARGDFDGTGTFRRPRAGEAADLCFDWDVHITRPFLRALCPAACRLYLWNHAYAMADGARSLQAEIERRRR